MAKNGQWPLVLSTRQSRNCFFIPLKSCICLKIYAEYWKNGIFYITASCQLWDEKSQFLGCSEGITLGCFMGATETTDTHTDLHWRKTQWSESAMSPSNINLSCWQIFEPGASAEKRMRPESGRWENDWWSAQRGFCSLFYSYSIYLNSSDAFRCSGTRGGIRRL